MEKKEKTGKTDCSDCIKGAVYTPMIFSVDYRSIHGGMKTYSLLYIRRNRRENRAVDASSMPASESRERGKILENQAVGN